VKHRCSVSINKPVAQIWKLWTEPSHIVCWNFAYESWYCPSAINDLVIGGKFSYRMEVKQYAESEVFSEVALGTLLK
jgi:uncharacterized protein YndB with AHSA1/START domain